MMNKELLALVLFAILFLYGCIRELQATPKVGCCDPRSLTDASGNYRCQMTGEFTEGLTVARTISCNEDAGFCDIAISFNGEEKEAQALICTDTELTCYQPSCKAQVCGPFKYNPKPIPSYSDTIQFTEEVKSNPGAARDTSVFTKTDSQNLYGAACLALNMDNSLKNVFDNTKGSFLNSYRFGVGGTFALFERFRYFVPTTDKYCGFNDKENAKDRFINYHLTPADYDIKEDFLTEDITGVPKQIRESQMRRPQRGPLGLIFPFEYMAEPDYCPTPGSPYFTEIGSTDPEYKLTENRETGLRTLDTNYYANLLPIIYKKELEFSATLRSEEPYLTPFECDGPLSCMSGSCRIDNGYRRDLCKTGDGKWVSCGCNSALRSCDSASAFLGNKPTEGTDGMAQREAEYDAGQLFSFNFPKQVTFYRYELQPVGLFEGRIHVSKVSECITFKESVWCGPRKDHITVLEYLPRDWYIECNPIGSNKAECRHYFYNPEFLASSGRGDHGRGPRPESSFICDYVPSETNPAAVKCGILGQQVQFYRDSGNTYDRGVYYQPKFYTLRNTNFDSSFDTNIHFFGQITPNPTGDPSYDHHFGNIGYALLDEEDFKETNLYTACRLGEGDYDVSEYSYADGVFTPRITAAGKGVGQIHPPDPEIPDNVGTLFAEPDDIICSTNAELGCVFFRRSFILLEARTASNGKSYLGVCELDDNFIPVTKQIGWCESCSYSALTKKTVRKQDIEENAARPLVAELNNLLKQGVLPILDFSADEEIWNADGSLKDGRIVFETQKSLAEGQEGAAIIIVDRIGLAQVNDDAKQKIAKRAESIRNTCGNCQTSLLIDNPGYGGIDRTSADIATVQLLSDANSPSIKPLSNIDVISIRFHPYEFTRANANLCNFADVDLADFIYQELQRGVSGITQNSGKPTVVIDFDIILEGFGNAQDQDCWNADYNTRGDLIKDPNGKLMAKLLGKQSGLTAIGLMGILLNNNYGSIGENAANYGAPSETPLYCPTYQAGKLLVDKPFTLYSKIYTQPAEEVVCEICSDFDKLAGRCTKTCANGNSCTMPEGITPGHVDYDNYKCPANALPDACTSCPSKRGEVACTATYQDGTIQTGLNYRFSRLDDSYADIISSLPYGELCCLRDDIGTYSYIKSESVKSGSNPIIFSERGDINEGCGVSDIDFDPKICGVTNSPFETREISCELVSGAATCNSDADCDSNEACSTVEENLKICRTVECRENSQCPRGKTCDAAINSCVAAPPGSYCTSSADCTRSQYCDVSLNECTALGTNECYTDDQCIPGKICNTNTGTCVIPQEDQCFSDYHCAFNEYCDTSTNFCSRLHIGQCNIVGGGIFPDGLSRCRGNECDPVTHTCQPAPISECTSDSQCGFGFYCSEAGNCEPLFEGLCSAYVRDGEPITDLSMCSSGEKCNGVSHTCQPPCTNTNQCPAGALCYRGNCLAAFTEGSARISCFTDAQCPFVYACDTNANLCYYASQQAGFCRVDSHCNFNKKCNFNTNSCVPLGRNECRNDGSCVTSSWCVIPDTSTIGACEPIPEGSCRSDINCDTSREVCDGQTRTCVAIPPSACNVLGRGDSYCAQYISDLTGCTDGAACGFCNDETNRCLDGCKDDSVCPSGEQCDSETRYCIKRCIYDSDCPTSPPEACFPYPSGAGTCQPVECRSNADCTGGKICDTDYRCVEYGASSELGTCLNDDDCPSYAECNNQLRCDYKYTGCSSNYDCPSGRYCTDSNSCFYLSRGACLFDDDCSEGQYCTTAGTDTQGTCTSLPSCLRNSDCPERLGLGCSGSVCYRYNCQGMERNEVCFTDENDVFRSSTRCRSNSDCPSGTSCQPLPGETVASSRFWLCR